MTHPTRPAGRVGSRTSARQRGEREGDHHRDLRGVGGYLGRDRQGDLDGVHREYRQEFQDHHHRGDRADGRAVLGDGPTTRLWAPTFRVFQCAVAWRASLCSVGLGTQVGGTLGTNSTNSTNSTTSRTVLVSAGAVYLQVEPLLDATSTTVTLSASITSPGRLRAAVTTDHQPGRTVAVDRRHIRSRSRPLSSAHGRRVASYCAAGALTRGRADIGATTIVASSRIAAPPRERVRHVLNPARKFGHRYRGAHPPMDARPHDDGARAQQGVRT